MRLCEFQTTQHWKLDGIQQCTDGADKLSQTNHRGRWRTKAESIPSVGSLNTPMANPRGARQRISYMQNLFPNLQIHHSLPLSRCLQVRREFPDPISQCRRQNPLRLLHLHPITDNPSSLSCPIPTTPILGLHQCCCWCWIKLFSESTRVWLSESCLRVRRKWIWVRLWRVFWGGTWWWGIWVSVFFGSGGCGHSEWVRTELRVRVWVRESVDSERNIGEIEDCEECE